MLPLKALAFIIMAGQTEGVGILFQQCCLLRGVWVMTAGASIEQGCMNKCSGKRSPAVAGKAEIITLETGQIFIGCVVRIMAFIAFSLFERKMGSRRFGKGAILSMTGIT